MVDVDAPLLSGVTLHRWLRFRRRTERRTAGSSMHTRQPIGTRTVPHSRNATQRNATRVLYLAVRSVPRIAPTRRYCTALPAVRSGTSVFLFVPRCPPRTNRTEPLVGVLFCCSAAWQDTARHAVRLGRNGMQRNSCAVCFVCWPGLAWSFDRFGSVLCCSVLSCSTANPKAVSWYCIPSLI